MDIGYDYESHVKTNISVIILVLLGCKFIILNENDDLKQFSN